MTWYDMIWHVSCTIDPGAYRRKNPRLTAIALMPRLRNVDWPNHGNRSLAKAQRENQPRTFSGPSHWSSLLQQTCLCQTALLDLHGFATYGFNPEQGSFQTSKPTISQKLPINKRPLVLLVVVTHFLVASVAKACKSQNRKDLGSEEALCKAWLSSMPMTGHFGSMACEYHENWRSFWRDRAMPSPSLFLYTVQQRTMLIGESHKLVTENSSIIAIEVSSGACHATARPIRAIPGRSFSLTFRHSVGTLCRSVLSFDSLGPRKAWGTGVNGILWFPNLGIKEIQDGDWYKKIRWTYL